MNSVNRSPEFGMLSFIKIGVSLVVKVLIAQTLIFRHADQVWNMLRADAGCEMIGPIINCFTVGCSESEQCIYRCRVVCVFHGIPLFCSSGYSCNASCNP